MRCEYETFELPYMPERPVAPPKTTQAERMQRMAYQGPKERRRCETCVRSVAWHGEQRRCMQGGFPVLLGGICNEWAAA